MWKGRTIRKIVAVVLAGLMTGMLADCMHRK